MLKKVLKATQYTNVISVELEDRTLKASQGCCILHTECNDFMCSISKDGDIYVRQICNGAIAKQAPITELSDLKESFGIDLDNIDVIIDTSTTSVDFKQWATAG